MKDLESKAVELLTKFDDLATQYAPDVIDAALNVVVINGLSSIITSLSLFFAVWLLYKFLKVKIDGIEDEVGKFIGIVFFWLLLFSMSSAAFARITEIWNWIAIFDPKLALAHKLLGL